MLEAQQCVFSKRPDAATIDINVDAPALAMRRLVAKHRA